jgi:predicted dehydrogenase
MKNVLVVGFGMMGCRHVQALLQRKGEMNVIVLEPSIIVIEESLLRIGANRDDCTWVTDISEVQEVIDVAVIATSSAPRYRIVSSLIEKGIKNFLLEKIVFQSEEQFDTILKIAEENDVKLYCNFVNRYFKPYRDIKSYIQLVDCADINMTIIGGPFGLGCNAIHYIDIYQFITGCDEINVKTADVSIMDIENRRGNQYKEFKGKILVSDQSQKSLFIISDEHFQGGVVITIKAGDKTFILNEQTKQVYETDGKTISQSDFEIIPTSMLSALIVEEIIAGKCNLTRLEETKSAHFSLFNLFNQILTGNHSSSMICPIT